MRTEAQCVCRGCRLPGRAWGIERGVRGRSDDVKTSIGGMGVSLFAATRLSGAVGDCDCGGGCCRRWWVWWWWWTKFATSDSRQQYGARRHVTSGRRKRGWWWWQAEKDVRLKKDNKNRPRSS